MKRMHLRVARAQADISQVDLAIKAGLSQKKIFGIEHGYRLAKEDEQQAIATALGVSPAAIAWPKGG